MNKTKVLVVMGGPSSEHEVSLQTGQMVLKNIDKERYDLENVVIEKNGNWRFADEVIGIGEAITKIRKEGFGLVFIALHGAFGEDGHLQAILDSINIPYTGSGMEASAMAMDKFVSCQLYEQNGLLVPNYQKITKNSCQVNIPLPIIIKPIDGGSSVGIGIAKKESEVKVALDKAFCQSDSVIVQQYLSGKEFTCGVIENEQGELLALPPIEIRPKISAFFDYKAKYNDGGSEEIVNPNVGEDKLNALKELALKAHRTLGCRGFSRTDFIESNDKFYVIETNTIPGLTKNSLLPKSAKAAGIEFQELIDLMIKAGLRGGA